MICMVSSCLFKNKEWLSHLQTCTDGRFRNYWHTFYKGHEPADIILKKTDKIDSRQYTDIPVKCKKEVKLRAIEYLNETIVEEYANGNTLMNLTVVENEQLWLGTLLSWSDNIVIISPEKNS